MLLGAAVEGVALFGLVDDAEAAVSVLDNHNLTFDADGIADLRAGRIDPRVDRRARPAVARAPPHDLRDALRPLDS